MGTDQGKISSINALGIVSKILKKIFLKLEQQLIDHLIVPLIFLP